MQRSGTRLLLSLRAATPFCVPCGSYCCCVPPPPLHADPPRNEGSHEGGADVLRSVSVSEASLPSSASSPGGVVPMPTLTLRGTLNVKEPTPKESRGTDARECGLSAAGRMVTDLQREAQGQGRAGARHVRGWEHEDRRGQAVMQASTASQG